MKRFLIGFTYLLILLLVYSCSGCNSKNPEIYPYCSYKNDSATIVTITNTNFISKKTIFTNYISIFKDVSVSVDKNNIIGLGYSICNNFMINYNRKDIVDFGRFGIGAGSWSSINTIDPYRRFDIGGMINLSF